MVELLQNLGILDAEAFKWVNSGLSNPLFDALLPWCRERWVWAPVYLFVIAFSIFNFGKKGALLVLGLVLTVGAADFTSSTLIKKNVRRLRPCNTPELRENMRLRAPCGGGYSFTSSHAANHFAAAFFLIGAFGAFGRWIRPVALSWAAVIAFSQVYVGVHYPADVLFGAGLGSVIGISGIRMWKMFVFEKNL
jgi:membrane-associated phospholipid phosphatase